MFSQRTALSPVEIVDEVVPASLKVIDSGCNNQQEFRNYYFHQIYQLFG